MRKKIIIFFSLCFFTLVFGDVPSAQVTLAWDPNPESDLAGYKIHYGLASGQYNTTIDVGNVIKVTVNDLDYGKQYFFVATAYNTAGLESDPSNEVSYMPELPAPKIEGKE